MRQAELVELSLDERQRRIEAASFLVVGGVADGDQQTFLREQPATAAPVDRFAFDLDIGRMRVPVDGRDSSPLDARDVASIATGAEDRHTDRQALAAAGDSHRLDRNRRTDGDQADVRLVGFIGQKLCRNRLPRLRVKEVDEDRAASLGFAENVAAGEDQQLVAPPVDNGAAPVRVPGRVFDAQSHGRGGRLPHQRIER